MKTIIFTTTLILCLFFTFSNSYSQKKLKFKDVRKEYKAKNYRVVISQSIAFLQEKPNHFEANYLIGKSYQALSDKSPDATILLDSSVYYYSIAANNIETMFISKNSTACASGIGFCYSEFANDESVDISRNKIFNIITSVQGKSNKIKGVQSSSSSDVSNSSSNKSNFQHKYLGCDGFYWEGIADVTYSFEDANGKIIKIQGDDITNYNNIELYEISTSADGAPVIKAKTKMVGTIFQIEYVNSTKEIMNEGGETVQVKGNWLISIKKIGNNESNDLPQIEYQGKKYMVMAAGGDTQRDQYSWNNAVKVCEGSTYGGYIDWVLPSKEILNVLSNNKDKIGSFYGYYYWSSSEINQEKAWRQFFDDGTQSEMFKTSRAFARCVRSL